VWSVGVRERRGRVECVYSIGVAITEVAAGWGI
jgi:hypothetical protein